MPIHLELIKENRVLLQTYSDPLDMRQMNELKTKMNNEILPAAKGKLHIIADFGAIYTLPGTILLSGTAMLRKRHPNTGLIVCITPNAFIDAIARILTSLVPHQSFKLVKTLEEAFTEIEIVIELS